MKRKNKKTFYIKAIELVNPPKLKWDLFDFFNPIKLPKITFEPMTKEDRKRTKILTKLWTYKYGTNPAKKEH